MTTFILPAEPLPAGTRKRGSYGSVLTHIIRASSDAEDAARLFASLLLDARPWGFARFDAHVGDTACHIRASLVREVYTVCKRHDAAGYASWLEAAAARFERIRKAAQTTCLQLTRHRVNPAILGLSAKFDTLGNIIKALLSLDNTAVENRDSASAIPCPYFCGRCEEYCRRGFELRQQPDTSLLLSKPEHLIRLVVYSYVLSKYKRFIVTDSGLGCRLQPKMACSEGLGLVKPYWNFENKDYRQATSKPVLDEFAALQAWLSHFGCVWLQSPPSASSRGSMQSKLTRASILTSIKGTRAAACFPAFLLLRDLWAESRPELILVDRFFCSYGCHYHLLAGEIKSVTPAEQRGAPRHIRWQLTETSTAALARHKTKTSPCLVFVGNSIHGTSQDYVGRVLNPERSTAQLRVAHHDQSCAEFRQHAGRLGAADLDRMLLASFAAHRSYCIPLGTEMDKNESLEPFLSGLGSDREIAEFKRLREANRAIIHDLGAGSDNLQVFGLQHIFSETKFGVSQLVQSWARNDNLSPLPV